MLQLARLRQTKKTTRNPPNPSSYLFRPRPPPRPGQLLPHRRLRHRSAPWPCGHAAATSHPRPPKRLQSKYQLVRLGCVVLVAHGTRRLDGETQRTRGVFQGTEGLVVGLGVYSLGVSGFGGCVYGVVGE